MVRVMEDPVVEAAQLAFSVRLKGSTDVSENTKNAQAIAKAWRSAVHALDPDRFEIEAMVIPELDQKIDIVDREMAAHTSSRFRERMHPQSSIRT